MKMALLIKETKTWRVEDENSAIQMIEDYRGKSRTELYEVNKASYVKKQKKQKGEVVDEYCVVEITFIYE